MTDQELERRLAKAVSETAPNDLEGVLSRCETRKGKVIQMTTGKKKAIIRNVIAACLALALLGVGGGMIYQQNYAVASVISLDVNPSIELKVNKQEKVLSCEALNAEAKEVLASMDGGASLEGTKLDVAVNAIVGALVRNGYLESISSAILISVEDRNQSRAAKLRQELTASVDVVLQEQAADGAVLSQTVEKDSGLEQQAKANNISTGKAALISRVLALNGSLKFDELAGLTVSELKDMIEAGAPGMPIGKEAALSKAIEYAGLDAVSALYWEVDSELDEAVAYYEVDLYLSAGEYEYKVEAYTGEILQGRANILDNTGGNTGNTGGTAAQSMIGETEAFNIAAGSFYEKYPELRGGNIFNNRVSLDRDDGKVHYDVEFFVGGYEVDYEIDAYFGTVISFDTDYEGPVTIPDPTPEPTPDTSTGDIGQDRAKAIALQHAGLTEAQVTRIQVEKDRDDGRVEYEVDFRADGMEYEYTIDAATGAVLEHEKDWDD